MLSSSPGETYQIQTGETSTCLTIAKVTLKQAGTFKCAVKNELGTTETETVLQVNGERQSTDSATGRVKQSR